MYYFSSKSVGQERRNQKKLWGMLFRKLVTWSRDSVPGESSGGSGDMYFRYLSAKCVFHFAFYRRWVHWGCMGAQGMHVLERDKIFQYRIFRRLSNGDNVRWLWNIHIRMRLHFYVWASCRWSKLSYVSTCTYQITIEWHNYENKWNHWLGVYLGTRITVLPSWSCCMLWRNKGGCCATEFWVLWGQLPPASTALGVWFYLYQGVCLI